MLRNTRTVIHGDLHSVVVHRQRHLCGVAKLQGVIQQIGQDAVQRLRTGSERDGSTGRVKLHVFTVSA